ncbi:MAG: ABC transporter permease subunit [Acidimicrobiales bacterium]|nr:ABC transporter permease subunit [Acidimicrobiales bacterium]
MIRITVTEFKRLMSRRMTWFFPLGLAALMVGGIVIAYFVIENDDDNTPNLVQDIAGGVELESYFVPIAVLLPLMAFVIGSSYFGADVKTGMIEQILTWEPRRLRLLSARLVSAVVGVAILAAILAVIYVGLTFVLAGLVGTTDGTNGEFWGNVVKAIGRLAVAGGLFCAFGLGVTVITNNSLASIVGFFIYWFIIENLIGLFLRKVSVYAPITNATAFANRSDVERIEGSAFQEEVDLVVSHGWRAAGLILAGWSLLSIVVGAFMFNRRDIA